jgi:hypothetical protein
MKKLLCVLFVVMMAAAGSAGAQEDEGIGLSLGLELGAGNVADEAVFSLIPKVVYENSFGALDLFSELDYTIEFDDPTAHSLYFEGELGYNLQLTDPGVLSIILNDKSNYFLSPALEEGATHEGVVEPALKYTHTLDFGDLSVKAALPFYYLTGVKDETAMDLEGTLGWASTFGLGLEFTGIMGIKPDSEFAGFRCLVSYEQDIFYGEVEVFTDKEFKSFEIYPEIDLTFAPWTLIVRAEFYKWDGSDDWVVRPFIGGKYSF